MGLEKRVLVVVILGVAFLLTITNIFAATQENFILDTDSPSFTYSEVLFNNTNSTQQHDFNSTSLAVLYHVTLPKNSTVTSTSLNVTGKIVPVYSVSANGEDGILGISIGDVTLDVENELVTGTNAQDGSLRILYGQNGTLRQGASLLFGFNRVLSTFVGNVTPYDGDEMIAGVEDNRVYVVEWDETLDADGDFRHAWNYTTGADVNSVFVDDIDADGLNDVIAGSNRVYVINYDGSLKWDFGVGNVISVTVGEIHSDAGKEVIVGNDSGITALNSTGKYLWSKSFGAVNTINSIHVDDVTGAAGNEIIIGTANGRAYLTQSDGTDIWNYLTGDQVNSVFIGDVVAPVGNEVVVGSEDGKIYTIDSSGNLIWDFVTTSRVKTVAIGNLTPDSGDEVAAGDVDGFLYTFNFDYFPENVNLSIGGTEAWLDTGKLRDEKEVTGFEAEINSFLSTCTPDANGNCDVPLVFSSIHSGRLNLTYLNITYDYDSYPGVSYQLISDWSRTDGIYTNESVGNQVRNIVYDYTSNPVIVSYVRVNAGAATCDFNGTRRTVTTIDSTLVCDVPDFTIPVSGNLPSSTFLWDNTMSTGEPVLLHENAVYYTTGVDNYYWRFPIDIVNNTNTLFTNVVGTASLDDTEVHGGEFLNITWLGTTCDIIPGVTSANCDTAGPTYIEKTCGSDSFYVCKKDTNSDNVADLFKWVQPYANTNVAYELGGETNVRPTYSAPSVTTSPAIWGNSFDFNLTVNDTENDLINVTLWLYKAGSNTWENLGTDNLVSNGTAVFSIASDSSWVGINSYLFEIRDYNSTDATPVHSAFNTSSNSGPEVTKHPIEMLHLFGDGFAVNRSETIQLIALANDTAFGSPVQSGHTCIFWISQDGSTYSDRYTSLTNATGYCELSFTPDQTYQVGSQNWLVGLEGSPLYQNTNSTDFTVYVKGWLDVVLTTPSGSDAFHRSTSNTIEAKLIDQYGNDVSLADYVCTFYFGNTSVNLGDSNTTGAGLCSSSYVSNCGDSLGSYFVNVSLSQGVSTDYTIVGSQDETSVTLKGYLNSLIMDPVAYSSFYKLDTTGLETSVNDSCAGTPSDVYGVEWKSVLKHLTGVNVIEADGVIRTNEVIVLTGTQLNSSGVNLDDWIINKTQILQSGSEIPVSVKAWTDGTRSSIDSGKTTLDQFSEVAFLTDLNAFENKGYWIHYGKENQTDYGFSYILNSGFETGDLSSWICSDLNCNDANCNCIISTEADTEDYSLYLSAQEIVDGSYKTASQNVPVIGSNYLKVHYKAWGTYGDGSYITITGGTGTCNINPSGSPISQGSAIWNTTFCNDTGFQTATSLTITVHDEGNGGSGTQASHVYIDYICIADTAGNCLSYTSGDSNTINFVTETTISNTENTTWQIPSNETPGVRSAKADAWGDLYETGSNQIPFYLFGRSSVTAIDLYSDGCINLGQIKCMGNSSIDLYCDISDEDSGSAVEKHNVSFYSDASYIGSSQTNTTGWSRFLWLNSTDQGGIHNIECRIVADASIFYDATPDNNDTIQINITTGNTTGDLIQLPVTETATNLKLDSNYTFTIDLIINNTGDETMFNPVITIPTLTGIYSTPATCTSIAAQSTCATSSEINVTAYANIGSELINISAEWTNGDVTKGLAYNNTTVVIDPTTVLNIVESNVISTAPIGARTNIANFTVEAFGNTPISSIVFDVYGPNTSELLSWSLEFTPTDITTISKNGNTFVQLFATLPLNASLDTYYIYIRANATGSSCFPESDCWDAFFLNLTVTEQDWFITPETLTGTIGIGSISGTIGNVLVTNNINQDLNFDTTVTGNSSGNITAGASNFDVQNLSSTNLAIHHNATTASTGTYIANVTITNNDGATPTQKNVSVSLDIINLRVDILLPTSLAPQTNVNNGTEINIQINSTFDEVPITDSMIWRVEIESEECVSTTPPIVLAQTWWLNCSAPFIQGNPINTDLRVIGNYTPINGMTLSDEESNAIKYVDVTPPQFSGVSATSVDQAASVPTIEIRVNITDNTAIDNAWVIVEYSGVNVTIPTYDAIFGNEYRFTFNNPNVATEYTIHVFANDTLGQANSTTGWFDVYIPVNLIINTTDPDGDNKTMNIIFYKPGTSDLIHTFEADSTQGLYTFSARKRSYDAEFELNNHFITFNSFDVLASLLLQHNSTDADNLTNSFIFDTVTLNDSTDIGNIALPADAPDAARNILLAVVIEPSSVSYSNINLVIDYTQALNDIGKAIPETYIRVFRCGAWNLDSRTCSDSFVMVSGIDDTNIDVAANTMSFTLTSTSSYALAEWCRGLSCGEVSPPTPTGTSNTGGGGGSTPPSTTDKTATCGNGICETGENTLNCATDCLQFPFTVKTSLGDIRMHIGENKTHTITVTNVIQRDLAVSLSVTGEVSNFIFLEKDIFNLDMNQSETLEALVLVPRNTEPGVYTGVLTVSADGKTQEIPIILRTSIEGDSSLSMIIDIITKSISPEGDLKFGVDLKNTGFKDRFNITLTYILKKGDTEEIVKQESEVIEIIDTENFIKTIGLRGLQIPLGNYFLEVWADFGETQSVKDIEVFDVVESFWDSLIGRIIIIAIILIVAGAGGYFGRKRYIKWKKSKARYVFPLNYKKLPQPDERTFWIGNVAETKKKAWFNLDDLTTHVIIAGSTGAGKSVAASVFVEEALDRKIPVIVFDPTSQWTGFVKALKDDNLLKHYPKFGMDKLNVRPYKGMIFEVTQPKMGLDIKKYMNPGEITVFTLDKLKPGEYDQAVQDIISSMFKVRWEESTSLRMLIVFDEVHRLLEKYGGKGGYIWLEKAAREFRKWGIGIVMCSQVLTDFKEAIAGNILTDIQLNTKSLSDIKKVEEKYGSEFAQRISRQAIGVGMIQNPKYNDGKPYFVNFRPTWHNPHKITNEEMEIYKEFTKRLEVVEQKVAEMKAKGQDIFDVSLEVKLAKDKLKLGRFRMAKIYITSLEEHLSINKKKPS